MNSFKRNLKNDQSPKLELSDLKTLSQMSCLLAFDQLEVLEPGRKRDLSLEQVALSMNHSYLCTSSCRAFSRHTGLKGAFPTDVAGLWAVNLLSICSLAARTVSGQKFRQVPM